MRAVSGYGARTVIPPEYQSRTSRHKARRRSLLVLGPAALLGAATAAQAIADDASSRLDQLMAGYVLNFTKFVEWPESSHPAQLVICVAGNPGLYHALRTGGGGASAGARQVIVREIEDTGSIAGCHVLYMEQPAHVAQLDTAAPLLTVSDVSGFADAGGTIELYTQQNRLRFIINLENARRAGLRISSNLLQLAAAVQDGEPK